MLEPIENQYILIGHINRSHGVRGEVLIISELFAPTLFDEIDLVNLRDSRGDLVPARVESVRVEEKQNRLSFFVKFEHVADRNQADALKGRAVFVEREIAERLREETDLPQDYSTYEVYDEQDRKMGSVDTTIDNPAHPILQIVTNDGRQLLVPFVDEYIRSCNDEDKIITCHNLDQLDEL